MGLPLAPPIPPPQRILEGCLSRYEAISQVHLTNVIWSDVEPLFIQVKNSKLQSVLLWVRGPSIRQKCITSVILNVFGG